MTFNLEDSSVQKCTLQTPKRGYVIASKTTTAQKPCTTILSASIPKGDGRDILSVLDSKKFSWLSPALTVSTASSPADSNDIWDPPETPTKRTSNASPRRILTPLTPPTPPDSSIKPNITLIPNPFFGVGVSPAAEQPLSDDKEAASQNNPFRPLKLFQGVTFVLESLSKENATAACVNYSINPSFVFTQDTSISSRIRSKTSTSTSVMPAIPSSIHKETISIESSQPRISLSPQNKFSKLLEQLIPHDLHARLASNPGYCAASLVTSPSTQCRYKAVPRGSLSGISGTVKSLATCKSQQDYRGMLRHIETIVQSVMCCRHQDTAMKQFKAGSRISQLRSRLEDITRMTKVDHSTLTQWVNSISDLDARIIHTPRLTAIATNFKPTTQLKQLSKPVFKASSTQTVDRFSFSSGFMPYQPMKTQTLSISSALYEKAASPLGTKDLTSGFVYLFWDKAYFGMVKIGNTNDLTKRLADWNRKCKRKHDYHSSAESQVEMPHVHRVEQLIHTELKECRLRRRCDGCGKLHQEWFEADEVHVVRVMKKWREWILQEPYVLDKQSGEWVIKPEMLASLEQICEPLPQDATTQKSRRSSGGVQRGSPKRRSSRRTL
ncbi:T5orf172 multi-domain protein [Pyrenophora tritici-repentis]|nr:T5orf172 domain containing protein [Pyrenophora tritici-repentis]KAI2478042.1 T5orf172 multi-domain protein [Pyrenophora tritici-repentis]